MIGGWPIESLRAGAMAVKTYAWYWVNRREMPEYGQMCGQHLRPGVQAGLLLLENRPGSGRHVEPPHGARRHIFPAYYYAGAYNGDPTTATT